MSNKSNFPSADDLRAYIQDSPEPVTRRELARAFHIKGEEPRRALKKLLKELEADGSIERTRSKAYGAPQALPPVTVVEIIGLDGDGELLAHPAKWFGKGAAPLIYMKPERRGHHTLEAGDRVLARLSRIEKKTYDGRLIKRLDVPQNQIVGIFKPHKGGGYILPTDKKEKNDYWVPKEDMAKAKAGDLVIGEYQPGGGADHRRRSRGGQKQARITQVIGAADDPHLISLIAAHSYGLPMEFPAGAVKEAKSAKVPPLKGREDLRDMPLVTIDGADARDFDDAVFAEKTKDGWHLMVAIADVSYYVRPGADLDQEAYKRGNSTYFPDRVIPMLPEALSNDLCSLRPDEDRGCLAVHLWIDGEGKLVKYKFVRGLMRSVSRLTYEQVQAAKDGMTDKLTKPLLGNVIEPLYGAFEVLDKARQARGALDLNLPERRAVINAKGEITGIEKRVRLDSHRLIEEFMILANVAAARALEDNGHPCIFRIHPRPDSAKLDAVREFLSALGYKLAKGQVVQPEQLNRLLHKAAGADEAELISTIVLRSQSQAVYSPDNVGHFGLALRQYAHFTSPIRRYADLVVHRALIDRLGLGPGGISDDEEARLGEIAEHISTTERRSMEAERDAVDRYTALYLEEHLGAEFEGRINGVTRFGLFVTLNETGADGLVPIRSLPGNDYYVHDEGQHALIGRETGTIYRLCAPVRVRLKEADSLIGSTVFELVDDGGAELPGFDGKKFKSRTPRSGKRGPPRGKGRGKGPRKNGKRRRR